MTQIGHQEPGLKISLPNDSAVSVIENHYSPSGHLLHLQLEMQEVVLATVP